MHEMYAHFAGELFGGSGKATAQSVFLSRGIDGEQAEVSAVAVPFDIDTRDELAVFFDDQKGSFPEIFLKLGDIQPVFILEESLHVKGAVDEAQERVEVGFGCHADLHISNVTHRISANDRPYPDSQSGAVATDAGLVGRIADVTDNDFVTAQC